MIRYLENGSKVIELGKGTTYISQVLVEGDTMSSGIAFSNKPPVNGVPDREDVIIEITSMGGAISYMKAVVELLKTWEIEELDKPINDLLNVIKLTGK